MLNAAAVDVVLVLAALRQVLEVHRCTGCAGDHIHSVLVLAASRHLGVGVVGSSREERRGVCAATSVKKGS